MGDRRLLRAPGRPRTATRQDPGRPPTSVNRAGAGASVNTVTLGGCRGRADDSRKPLKSWARKAAQMPTYQIGSVKPWTGNLSGSRRPLICEGCKAEVAELWSVAEYSGLSADVLAEKWPD